MNLCPCGFYPDRNRCNCSENADQTISGAYIQAHTGTV
ncbi:MAG: hypothetical protein ACLSAC_13065 [Enterocloster bolteae]